MHQMNSNKPEHVHFIGIGDISMSGPVEILLDEGFSVSGFDSHETTLTEHLETERARVYHGQRTVNIEREPRISVTVCMAVIREGNPEFRAVRDQEPPMLSRAEPPGELMRSYKKAIAVSGVHDRTITTSTLTDILLAGNLDPTISVRGILKDIGGNIRVGGPDLSMTEVCGHTNSFLSFYPAVGVILNVKEDHLNFLKDIEDIRRPFRLLAEKLPAKGLSVANNGIEKVKGATRGLRYKVITSGKDFSSICTVCGTTYDEFARPSYDPAAQGEIVTRTTLDVMREHNVYNSPITTVTALELGAGFDAVTSGLGRFTGADRRFEKKGEVVGVTAIDDYVHHLQEIEATLAAARNYPYRKLWCVFQPYTYARTKAFLNQFAEALPAVDEAVLADIYIARETDVLGVSSRDVAGRIEKLGTETRYIPSLDGIETFISKNCVSGDLLITMGVGDIVKVEEKLLG